MKLIEALQIANRARSGEGDAFRCFLGCGFTPLHLETYFRAYLAKTLAGRRIEAATGRYGDLAGSLERLDAGGLHGAAIALEWADLDPRLGLRHLGGWRQAVLADVAAVAEAGSERLTKRLEELASAIPVVLSLPSLPLPPAAHTMGSEQSGWEQQLAGLRQRLADWAVAQPGVRLVSTAAIDSASPNAGRLDAKSELACGFPYSLVHAEAIGRALAEVLAPPAPFKGLITDLDETLWSGILGEVGVQGVSWDLENHSLPHGWYQQCLGALAERGVLIAVASKNDAALVDEALGRTDLLVKREDLYPVLAHWGPKSDLVARILAAWNIGADSVVFIDDSPIELAEVQAAYPAMECVRFPKDEPAAVWKLLSELRDRFGKSQLAEEDRLRARSLRQAEVFESTSAGVSQDTLLASVDAVVTFSLDRNAGDARALELINKTNQFNLNGRRLTEGEWKDFLSEPDAFLLTASYRDKFGGLGKIAAALGRRTAGEMVVEYWVMSCRAFSRRIEHLCLRYLFERMAPPSVRFRFLATPRNTPLQECFGGLGIAEPEYVLTRAQFDARCPALFQRVEESSQ